MKNAFFCLCTILISTCLNAQEKQKVASVEPMHVKESNVLWNAAITDTLNYCVINANSIAVMNASFPKEKNITRQISFRVKNEKAEGRTINSTVSGLAEWNGSKHYTVVLELGVNFQTHMTYKKVDCILADLTDSEFKLLVGKNWLGDDLELK